MKPVTGTPRPALQLTCLLALVIFAPAAFALQFHAAHSDPVAPVILGVTTILFVALLGRFGARHLGMPSVIGELGMGILIGNVAYYIGFDMCCRARPARWSSTRHHVRRGRNTCIHC
jgi:hypothetical protein